ncbi:hypothetical protein B0H13DRAFT_1861673 [Mycena leptocephala]|nr:hypothetical protein B0H13DRAFT_1861673 [Mycena leptocephala]
MPILYRATGRIEPDHSRRSALDRRLCQTFGTSLSRFTIATSSVIVEATPTSTEKTVSTSAVSSSENSSGVAAGNFVATKPTDWPTATQAGPAPTSTVTSTSDLYLEELSKACDNSGVSDSTSDHTGDMTYYEQGTGACGDVYDDSSFTAAVSHLMYDAWPGANPTETNRSVNPSSSIPSRPNSSSSSNPICGPFVPGHTVLNSAGISMTAVNSSIPGHAEIGGDGLIDCVGSATVQCHIPLTATVSHGGKSIQVKIVDRFHGANVAAGHTWNRVASNPPPLHLNWTFPSTCLLDGAGRPAGRPAMRSLVNPAFKQIAAQMPRVVLEFYYGGRMLTDSIYEVPPPTIFRGHAAVIAPMGKQKSNEVGNGGSPIWRRKRQRKGVQGMRMYEFKSL